MSIKDIKALNGKLEGPELILALFEDLISRNKIIV